MTDNIGIVRAYMARIAAIDIEGALELAADEAEFRGPDGSVSDKAGVRALFASLRQLLVNPMQTEIVGTTCEGRRVAVEATTTALLGNGKTYNNIYHFLFEIEQGKIIAVREYCDTSRADAFV